MSIHFIEKNKKGKTKAEKKAIAKGIKEEIKIDKAISNAMRTKPKPVKAKKNKKNKFWSSLLGTAGEVAGSYFGMGPVGRKLGTKVAQIFGSGDYVMGPQVQLNSLMGSTPPSFANNTAQGRTIVAHREFVGDVYSGDTLVNGATAFKFQRYPINPGLPALFPWLADVAACFEQYEILGMVFEFKSTSGNALNTLNPSLGTVIMSVDYNADTPAFTTKMQQENYEFAQSVKASESALHGMECKKNQSPLSELYIRTGSLSPNQDIKTYDMGVFQLSTVGMQATGINLGELWVSYEIALYKPKLTEGGTSGSTLSRHIGLGTPTNANPFGSLTPISNTGTLAIFLDWFSNRLYLPNNQDGCYLIEIAYSLSSASTVTAHPTVTANNCALKSVFLNGSSSLFVCPSAGGTNTTRVSLCMVVAVTGETPNIILGAANYANLSLGDLIVSEFNPLVTIIDDQKHIKTTVYKELENDLAIEKEISEISMDKFV